MKLSDFAVKPNKEEPMLTKKFPWSGVPDKVRDLSPPL